MRYLLDTNICIYLIKKQPRHLLKRFRSHTPGSLGISSVTLAELQYGVEKSQFPAKNQEALDEFLFPLDTVSFDDPAARMYGKIKTTLERQGKIIGPLDLMIAAHALSLHLPVVTNNTKEFSRVPKLMVENWFNP